MPEIVKFHTIYVVTTYQKEPHNALLTKIRYLIT